MERNLLEYRDNGSVVIHLVYSEEQQHSEEERRLSQRIQKNKDQMLVLEEEYQRLSEQYESLHKVFQNTLSEYNKKVEQYNDSLSKWGKQGGIPAIKKPAVDEMQRQIQHLKAEVNRTRDNAESLRKQANARSKQLNKLIEQQNSLVENYNQKYAEQRTFDQGQYIQQNNDRRINIYQFSNRGQLKTVLAHEAGHALGLNHVDNSESVMHAIMRDQNIFDLRLTDEDKAAMQNRCGY